MQCFFDRIECTRDLFAADYEDFPAVLFEQFISMRIQVLTLCF